MSEAERRLEIFERAPVPKAIWTQIIPAIASQMIALIYNLADTYFVGMLNDPNQTAAVTVVSTGFVFLTAISNLFGVGGASMVARYLGEKKPEKAQQVSSVAFWGGMVSALVFAVLYFLFAEPILRLCGATESTYALAYEYAKWTVVIGSPATILNMLLANLVRAQGGAVAASVGVSMGGIINTILDPFFVLPAFLGYGAAGAGMATAISNYIGLTYFLVYLFRNRQTTLVKLSVGNLRYTKEYLGGILAIGFPSAVQNALTMVALTAQMNFVSEYETEAVAALGIVKKLDQLPIFFAVGTASGMLPLLAYNHAAGNHKRRQDLFKFGSSIAVGFAVLCLVCYEIAAPTLVGLFMDDPLTREYGARFLRIMVTAMPLMAVCYPMIVQFQALGRAKESLICSILRKGALDIPLLFVLDRLLPLYGCMLVQPIVDSIALIVVFVFYKRVNRLVLQK